MIDFQKIQDTLREWFSDASGIATYWFGEDVENLEHPYIELQINSSDGLGVDETREEYDDTQPAGEKIIRSQYGNRLFVLSAEAHTRDQTPTGAARYYLEKIRTALFKESTVPVFSAARLAFVGAEPLVNLDKIFQDRLESRAMMDIRFATIATETDPKERGTYIEETEISSDLKDPGGTSLPASLQLDKERIP